MFQQRNIIYFDPFYFKNGNTAKAKFFVVLKIIDNTTILASLPTSKDYIPSRHIVESGCIDIPEININCFVISPKNPITDCGKRFSLHTYLYGHNLDEYDMKEMESMYPIEQVNYIVWGKMKKEIFNELIACFSNSRTVKRKYKRLLSS